MIMSKFERRKRDLERKFQEELQAIQDAEKKEIEKKIDPIVSKLGRVVEEEARKALEANPDILDYFTFKKREAGKGMMEALAILFNADRPTEGSEVHKVASGEATQADEGKSVETNDVDPFSEGFGNSAADAKVDDAGDDKSGNAVDAGTDEDKPEDKKGFMSFSRNG